MKKLIVFLAVIGLVVGVSGLASASVVTYTNEALFTAQLAPGYYVEDFNYAPWTTIVDPAIASPQSFASGGWAYQLSSPSGLSGQTMSGGGGAVANYYGGQTVTATFTGTLPTAVGGIFWATALNGDFLNGGAVTVRLNNGGAYTYTDTSNWSAFTGFISDSPIASLSIQTGAFATMDHFIVGAAAVPEPTTMLLLGLGLVGLAGLRRKSRN